ncbi:hypothetical protein OH407_23755, partial [Salmonella enterica]|uniref:hypothetical protein n=1 Tax=Salmonella enterica TaxID=28901 RepID=UPI0022B6E027
LLPEMNFSQSIETDVYRLIEQQHQKLAANVPAVSLTTTLRLSNERLCAVRSDGVVHQASLDRASCEQRLRAGFGIQQKTAAFSSPRLSPMS